MLVNAQRLWCFTFGRSSVWLQEQLLPAVLGHDVVDAAATRLLAEATAATRAMCCITAPSLLWPASLPFTWCRSSRSCFRGCSGGWRGRPRCRRRYSRSRGIENSVKAEAEAEERYQDTTLRYSQARASTPKSDGVANSPACALTGCLQSDVDPGTWRCFNHWLLEAPAFLGPAGHNLAASTMETGGRRRGRGSVGWPYDDIHEYWCCWFEAT